MNNNFQYHYSSPFKYLNPYQKEDEHIFFGRSKEMDEVFDLFQKTNLVVIYGPCGSGKSSVARCGLTNRFNDWKSLTIRRNGNFIDSFFKNLEYLFKGESYETLNKVLDLKNSVKKGDELMEKLEDTISKLFENITYTPFFIFDQFEELFIEGKDDEIKKFSLLLSIITNKISFSNIVICIQTEFLANLFKFERYNPNILDYKCCIDDPTNENVIEIIKGTFEHFEINKKIVGYEPKNVELLPLLSEEEKEDRINQIIKCLEKKGKIHLPFLQIYLDKLYVIDFIRTYPNDKELLLCPEKIKFKNKPLHFTKDEIETYGDIENILTNYIQEVNNEVIEKNNKIEKKGHEDTVIKFLKHFISEKDTRQGIEVISKHRKNNLEHNYFIIKNEEIKKSIIKSIWSEHEVNTDESIGDIIYELIETRILVCRDNILEFTNNSLVQIVKNIPVEEDILEYYKIQFNSAFDSYIISKKSKKELLSRQQIVNFKGKINEILDSTSSDDIELTAKHTFWTKSKNKTRLQNYWRIGTYILAILITTIIVTIKVTSVKAKVNEQILEVAQLSLTDLTMAYKRMVEVKNEIASHPMLKIQDFVFGKTLYDSFIENYVLEPFYLKKIKLFTDDGKREDIITTKSRFLKDSEYILFAQTRTKLYSTTFKLNNTKHQEEWKEIPIPYGPISSFEPYGKGENIRVLFSNKNGLYDVGYRLQNKIIVISIKPEARKLTYLDHIKNKVFIATKTNKIITIKDTLLRNITPDNVDIKGAKSISKSDEILTVGKKGNNVIIFQNKWDSPLIAIDTINIPDSPKIKNVLKGFKIGDNKNRILFEDDRQIYSIDFNEFDNNAQTKPQIITKVNSFHEQQINSIDSHKKNFFLIGSNDKTASLYYDRDSLREGDEKLVKLLKGHTDAVLNVSFLDKENLKYVMTSSEDGTFAIWDIRPAELDSIYRPNEYNQMRLKYYNDSLYIGSDRGNGYLLKIGSDLVFNRKVRKILEIDRYPDIFNFKGSFNAFDIDPQKKKLYSGLRYSRRLIQFDENGGNVKEIFGWDNTISYKNASFKSLIFDLSVNAEKILLGTSDGVYYLPNYEKEKELFSNGLNTSVIRLEGTEGITINTVDIHPEGNFAIAASDNSNLYFCNLDDKSCTSLSNGHTDKVKDALFSPDGDYMISGSWDNTVLIWKYDKFNNTFKKLEKMTITTHKSDIEDLDVIEDGNLLIIASASSDKTVHLHSLNKEKKALERLPSIIRHDYGLRAITFGENSNIIYTADAIGVIKKWDRTKFLEIIKGRTVAFPKKEQRKNVAFPKRVRLQGYLLMLYHI